MHRTLAYLAGLSLALASSPGSAVMCYQIVDRSDTLIYQDTFPPVDLSDAGQPQRDQMRARGEQMIAADADKCPRLEFFTGNAGSSALSIDEVVAGMNARNMISAKPGTPTRVPDAPTSPRAPPATTTAPPSSGSRY